MLFHGNNNYVDVPWCYDTVHCLCCLCLFLPTLLCTLHNIFKQLKIYKIKQNLVVRKMNAQLVYSQKKFVLIFYIIMDFLWKKLRLKYPSICLFCWCPQLNMLIANFKSNYGNEKLQIYSVRITHCHVEMKGTRASKIPQILWKWQQF